MKIGMVLFDLDGTLLPMDQDVFVNSYFGKLAAKLFPAGYEPKELIAAVWAGTMAMIQNRGGKTNEAVFWDDFTSHYGEKAREDYPLFDTFYREEFDQVQQVCGFNPRAAETVQAIKNMGLRVALATNPIFPAVATEKRIRWAGLEPENFEWFTTYENSTYCKPNPRYYLEVAERLGVQPEECLMVGNDVGDDLPARETGMKVFLLTDCLINKGGEDISALPHGGFSELLAYVNQLKNEE